MKEMPDTMLALAESLVKYGRKKGSDQIQVSIGEVREFSAKILKGEIEKLVEAGSKSLSLKVIVDRKVATASSLDFSTGTLRRLVAGAIERAKLGSEDPCAGLPDREPAEVRSDALKLYDPTIEELTPDYKIDMAKRMEAICLADRRIVNSYGSSFSNCMGEFFLANSMGFSGCYKRSSVGLGIYLQAGSGDNLVEDGWYESALSFKKLPDVDSIAATAIGRATRLIGAKKIGTQNVPVVLEPNMTGELLGFIYSCISGGAIYRKQSFLVDRLGEKVGHDLLTIIDDGLMPGGLGSKPFDGEGVPARRTVVFESGVLKNYLMDTYAARKLKMNSTGNASGANNFYLTAGTSTPEEIVTSVDKGLLLTGVMGQGLNPVTGDLSRGAIGMWIERGEIAYPVAEITISGNLREIMQNIEIVGNDLKFRSVIAGPTVKIGEMTVGGI